MSYALRGVIVYLPRTLLSLADKKGTELLWMIESVDGSRFFRRGDVRLHYTVAGNGPTLIFIHGLPDFWKGWRYQIAHFSGAYRVVAVDLRGVNLSDQPPATSAYRISELVRDAVGLIDHLKLEQATIIGHDWGGFIGWWTAILAPKRVARLAALSAPHPACYAAVKEKGEVYHPPDYLAQVVAAAPGVPFSATRLAERVVDERDRTELADALRQSGVECLRNFYRANDFAQSKFTSFPPIGAPVLSLYGAKDRFVAPDAYEKSGSYVTGNFRVVVMPETAHYPHQEAPAKVNTELQRWLESS